MTKSFTIISGKPNDDELKALTQVIDQLKRVEKNPVSKRSAWMQPQLRAPLTKANNFSKGRKS